MEKQKRCSAAAPHNITNEKQNSEDSTAAAREATVAAREAALAAREAKAAAREATAAAPKTNTKAAAAPPPIDTTTDELFSLVTTAGELTTTTISDDGTAAAAPSAPPPPPTATTNSSIATATIATTNDNTDGSKSAADGSPRADGGAAAATTAPPPPPIATANSSIAATTITTANDNADGSKSTADGSPRADGAAAATTTAPPPPPIATANSSIAATTITTANDNADGSKSTADGSPRNSNNWNSNNLQGVPDAPPPLVTIAAATAASNSSEQLETPGEEAKDENSKRVASGVESGNANDNEAPKKTTTTTNNNNNKEHEQQKHPLGTTVCKSLTTGTLSTGIVTKYNAKSGKYLIEYEDDDDMELMEEHELEALINKDKKELKRALQLPVKLLIQGAIKEHGIENIKQIVLDEEEQMKKDSTRLVAPTTSGGAATSSSSSSNNVNNATNKNKKRPLSGGESDVATIDNDDETPTVMGKNKKQRKQKYPCGTTMYKSFPDGLSPGSLNMYDAEADKYLVTFDGRWEVMEERDLEALIKDTKELKRALQLPVKFLIEGTIHEVGIKKFPVDLVIHRAIRDGGTKKIQEILDKAPDSGGDNDCGADEKTLVRPILKSQNCMSCKKLFEFEGETEENKRLPIAPCSGCGCQVCLRCLRKDQHVDNQALSQNVRFPTPRCKGSFNAEEPVLNQLAGLCLRQIENQNREIDDMKKQVRDMKDNEKEIERTMKQIKQEHEGG